MEHASILVPLDGREGCDRLLDAAWKLARAYQARIEYLYVVNLREAISSVDIEKLGRRSALEEAILQGKEILNDVLDITPAEVAARGHCLSGEPAATILKAAGDIKCSLIVMRTHGIGAFKATFMGSVSSKVLERADCPVVLVKAIDEESNRG